MVWSEGNMLLKNPVTPPGIDPGTVRLVTQRLNHYATPDPTRVSTERKTICSSAVDSKNFHFDSSLCILNATARYESVAVSTYSAPSKVYESIFH